MTRRLHIGGVEKKEGWEILNISPDADQAFGEVYASQIQEYVDY